MDYKNYTEKRDDGLVELVKAGGGFAFAKKRYNQDTGSEESPEIVSVDLEKLQEKKLELQKEVDEIDVLIADIQSLGLVK